MLFRSKTAGISIARGDASGLTDAEKAAVGDRPLLRLTLTLDGAQTDWSNPDAPVTVTMPYTPTAEELKNPESIVVWYLDGSGTPVCVPNGHYDPATGTVTFTATHFSRFAVGYREVRFTDVKADAWYYKAVSFIAARGITDGTGNGGFSPGAALTRGQLLVLLMRTFDVAPEKNPADNFSDAGSTWYTGYLAAARRLGIAQGVGDNKFAPEQAVTRQEMFTLLYNTLKVLGRLPERGPDSSPPVFSDEQTIAPWAREAITYLAGAGFLSGSGGRLRPEDTATRAEMAQVIYTFITSMVQ